MTDDTKDDELSGDVKAGALARDVGALVSDSRESYGDAVANQRHIAAGWQWYLEAMYDIEVPIDGSDVARMMALLKLSRVAVGEYEIDHDRDMVGYGAIAGACAAERGEVDVTDLTAYSDIDLTADDNSPNDGLGELFE